MVLLPVCSIVAIFLLFISLGFFIKIIKFVQYISLIVFRNINCDTILCSLFLLLKPFGVVPLS